MKFTLNKFTFHDKTNFFITVVLDGTKKAVRVVDSAKFEYCSLCPLGLPTNIGFYTSATRACLAVDLLNSMSIETVTSESVKTEALLNINNGFDQEKYDSVFESSKPNLPKLASGPKLNKVGFTPATLTDLMRATPQTIFNEQTELLRNGYATKDITAAMTSFLGNTDNE